MGAHLNNAEKHSETEKSINITITLKDSIPIYILSPNLAPKEFKLLANCRHREAKVL